MARKITLAESQSLPDFLTNEAFVLMFGSIPGESDTKRLMLQCKTAPIPAETVESLEGQIAGYKKHQSGIRTWSGTLSVSFLETKDMAVLKRLRTWQQFCRGTQTGISVGYSEDYTRTGEVTVFDSTGKVATTCKIYKMFPTEIPEVSLDSSGSAAAVEVSVTFSFDYCDYGEETQL